MTNKIQAFICDIDGTIALHTEEQRSHFDYSKVSGDLANKPILDIVSRFISTGLSPVFMSGRADENDGQVREDTMSFLQGNIDQYSISDPLIMRPEFLPDGRRDFRKDYVVKEELYFKYVQPHYDILFAIDDRPQVLKMWHALGVPTLAVGTPWIDF